LKIRPIYFDSLFVIFLELILLGVYSFGPTPNQFPFLLTYSLHSYFFRNISQFFLVMYIPYLPELIFHLTNVSMSFFLGLSILWIPSLLVLIWLIREFFSKIIRLQSFHFYYSYLPILFTVFMPHTLIEIFSFNGSHFFSTLSQIFIMFISILSGIAFFLSGRKFFLLITLVSVLLVNVQTFSTSLFLVSILLLISVVFLQRRKVYSLRAILLAFIAVIASMVYLYASFGVSSFPYGNLAIPNIGPTDPNFRVFLLSIFSHDRGLWNIFTMQNYVNDPYFPRYYPDILYSIILFVITLISLLPLFYFNKRLRKAGITIYILLVGLELLNSLANPFISLIFPQNIGIFYDISYIFNNNLVFYDPLQIVVSLSFIFSILSLPDFLKFMKAHTREIFEFNFKILNKKLILYWRPAMAIIFAVVMVSPLVSFSVNHGAQNPVPYQDYEPFVSYFENHKNASVYFDNSVTSQIITLIESDSYSLSNPELSPDQAYPLSTAMQLYGEVSHPLQSSYLDYILTIFGYNYYATSNLSRYLELSSSGLFSVVLNYSGLQVLKITKPIFPSNLYLMSSSASVLIELIDNFKIFPTWIYSPYLLNISSLEKLYSENSTVYMPAFDNQYKFFIYLKNTKLLIPAQYSDNTYYTNQWEIGYLPPYAQDTWTQNIADLGNYTYQSEVNVNYGFIYSSQKNVSLSVDYSLSSGSYEVLANTLHSNVGGTLSISAGGNVIEFNTKSNDSYFTDSKLFEVNSSGKINVVFKNIDGFNTVGYLEFVPISTFNEYKPLFEDYANKSTIYSVFDYFGEIATYNISISTEIVDKSLTYEQSISIPMTLRGLNRNLSNMLISNQDGDLIPAFIQSINNDNAAVWIRLQGEFNRTLKILIFKSKLNLFGQYLGESPVLSPVYGEYFNAPLIFGTGNAWDWVNSYQGWNSPNSSATVINDGVHVYNGLDGGVYLQRNIMPGTAFTVFGWTENGTVIQFNGYQDSNDSKGDGFGFVGGNGYYDLQEYPIFTKQINVPEQKYLNYTFTLIENFNNTAEALINNTLYDSSQQYIPEYNINYIYLREAINDPQYFEYGFLKTIPVQNIMPIVTIS